MMLPCLKAKQSGALGRAAWSTFVVRFQTAQKGSGFQRARASLNAFPHPATKPSLCALASVCGPEVGLNKSAVTSGAGLLGLPEG